MQVGHELEPEDFQEIQEAFELFDTEKSGMIDESELKVAMRALGFMVRRPEVRRIMQERDHDNNGKIGFEEFVDIVASKIASRDPDEEIEASFQLFDCDNTGAISFNNLCQVADELGEDMDAEELKAMLHEFDNDQDGLISKFEFLDIMKQAIA
jgi:centrin-3